MQFLYVFGAILCWVGPSDIPLVENGPIPKAKPQTLHLEEDLRLDPDTLDGDYLFSGVNVHIEADANGNMYISDGHSNRVIVFSPKGKVLRTIGREGEGPGEFVALRQFHILNNGKALAFENLQNFSRINFYDGKFKFLNRQERTNTIFRIKSWRPSSTGETYACETVRIDTEKRILITRFLLTDTELNEKVAFGEFRQDEFDVTRVTDQKYWVNYLSAFFARELSGQKGYFAFNNRNQCFTAMGGSYEVTRWNAQRKPDWRMKRTSKPVFFDEEARRAAVHFEHERLLSELPGDLHRVVTLGVVERAFREADLPLAKRPVYGLVAMEKGFIVIGDTNHVTGNSRGDLFNDQGHYLGSFQHETRGLKNMIFKNGYAYTIGRNQDDENVAIRYKARLVSR